MCHLSAGRQLMSAAFMEIHGVIYCSLRYFHLTHVNWLYPHLCKYGGYTWRFTVFCHSLQEREQLPVRLEDNPSVSIDSSQSHHSQTLLVQNLIIDAPIWVFAYSVHSWIITTMLLILALIKEYNLQSK